MSHLGALWRLAHRFYLKRQNFHLHSCRFDVFYYICPPQKGLVGNVQPPGGFPGRHISPLPGLQAGVECRRLFLARMAEAHAPCLGCRDTLRLPLVDELPLRLSHITEQLQNDVGDQRPGEIPIFSGIQQGHIQHDNGRALLFGNDPPLLQNLIVISAQAVNALDVEQIVFLFSATASYIVDGQNPCRTSCPHRCFSPGHPLPTKPQAACPHSDLCLIHEYSRK